MADQSDHKVSTSQDTDEEVKSKPSLWVSPQASLSDGGGGGEASRARLVLDEPCEDLLASIVKREKVGEHIRYRICTTVSGVVLVLWQW